MKVRLLRPDRGVSLDEPLPPHAETLAEDLELATILDAMARGDRSLRDTVRAVLVADHQDIQTIRHRQAVLKDALANPAAIRELYALAVRGTEAKRDARFFWFRDSPDTIRQKSIGMLGVLFGVLREVRQVAERDAEHFTSDGFTQLFETLRRDLDDDYLQTVDRQLKDLRFARGALLSARLGRGNRGAVYALRKPNEQGFLDRLTTPFGQRGESFTIADRDEYGMQALEEIRGRGTNRVADALAQSTDHVLVFFAALRAELGFYVACLNLHQQLSVRGVATCMPEAALPAGAALSARGLRDAALAFHLDEPPVANHLDADGTQLVIVTGPNQGGKSTFLRSVGLAQLMMQAGMFVCADAYRASVAAGIYSHFKREEDPTMTRGKLEEELERMSEIADQIRPGSLLLCNESFSSTNEREGSEIARQVTRALTDCGIRVLFVTHLYDFAASTQDETAASPLFLRAERRADGTRTFRLVPGAPRPTSHGEDSYRRIFATAASAWDSPPKPA